MAPLEPDHVQSVGPGPLTNSSPVTALYGLGVVAGAREPISFRAGALNRSWLMASTWALTVLDHAVPEAPICLSGLTTKMWPPTGSPSMAGAMVSHAAAVDSRWIRSRQSTTWASVTTPVGVAYTRPAGR